MPNFENPPTQRAPSASRDPSIYDSPKFTLKYKNAQPNINSIITEAHKKALDKRKEDRLKKQKEEARQNGEVSEHTTESVQFDKVVFFNSQWFGSDAVIRRTSEFDDEINKIDLVVDFLDPETEEVVASLGVDTSMCSPDNLGKKLFGIHQKNRSGSLGKLDYNLDPKTKEAPTFSEVRDMPEIVAILSKDDLERYLNGSLNEDVVKSHILVEAIEQLRIQELIVSRSDLSAERKQVLMEKLEDIASRLEKEKPLLHGAEGIQDPIYRYASELPEMSKICAGLTSLLEAAE